MKKSNRRPMKHKHEHQTDIPPAERLRRKMEAEKDEQKPRQAAMVDSIEELFHGSGK